jgi:TolB-like protein/Tfp pilus assembly protein PilF
VTWATWPRPLGLLLDFYGLSGPPVNPPLPDKSSIVVLPFTNMSGDPEQEYFSDGITEELTSDLARIPELFVIARNSAFTYKGRAANVADVGRELGVLYVVEGSVRRSVDRVRVTAQLIDATTGFHLWSEQYDRDLADIFEVQSEISRAILVALSVEIQDATVDALARRSTRDLMAHDLFLRARSHLARFTREDNLEARRLCKRAVERDSSFALALAMIGATYSLEYSNQWNLDATLLERAEDWARRALELDPTTAMAHMTLSGVHLARGRLDEALAAAESAEALAANDDGPQLMLALVLARQGRLVAALGSLDRASRLDPRGTSLTRVVNAGVNLAAGRTQMAVELLERERAANSDTINARVPLAAIYEGEGRHDEAREVVREILRVNPNLTVEAVIQAMALTAAMAPEFKENLSKAWLPDKGPATQDFTVPGFGGAPAIAVLAFDNLSGDPEQEYFADGIAEDLITRLSSWREFPVIARNSSFTYKGQAVNVEQVGRELGARYVVEGSVRRAGGQVRISAQLIDATTGHHVWAEKYDRELEDIFAVQDEITESIVMSMRPELRRTEWERAVRRPPRDLRAYDLTQRGWWYIAKRTADDNLRARSLFEEAIEQDPFYAEAWSCLALTHGSDVLQQWTNSPARSISEQQRAARRSVSLDPQWAVGYVSLAVAYSWTGHRDEAVASAERAIELDPSMSGAYRILGFLIAAAGRPDDGIAKIETGMRLSPRDPQMWQSFQLSAVAHLLAARFAEAVDAAQRSLQYAPDRHNTRALLAISYAHLGKIDEAQSELREVLRLQPDYSLTGVRQIFAGMDEEFVERLVAGLHKAGLKE